MGINQTPVFAGNQFGAPQFGNYNELMSADVVGKFDQLFTVPSQATIDTQWTALTAEYPYTYDAGNNFSIVTGPHLVGTNYFYVVRTTVASSFWHYALLRKPITAPVPATNPVYIHLHGGTGGVGVTVFADDDSYLNTNYFKQNLWCLAPTYPGEKLDDGEGSPFGGPWTSGGDVDSGMTLRAVQEMYYEVVNFLGITSTEKRIFGSSRGATLGYQFAALTPGVNKSALIMGATNWFLDRIKSAVRRYYLSGYNWDESSPVISFIADVVLPYMQGTYTLEEAQAKMMNRGAGLFYNHVPDTTRVLHGNLDETVYVDHSRYMNEMMSGSFQYTETPGAKHVPDDLNGVSILTDLLIN